MKELMRFMKYDVTVEVIEVYKINRSVKANIEKRFSNVDAAKGFANNIIVKTLKEINALNIKNIDIRTWTPNDVQLAKGLILDTEMKLDQDINTTVWVRITITEKLIIDGTF